MTGAQPVTGALPAGALAPFETRYLTSELLQAAGLRDFSGMINLSVSFEGRGDDLVMATGSTEQSGTYVFVVEPQGLGRSFSKEGHYWKFADGFDTMFTLWNPTDKQQDFLVTFFFGSDGGQYKLPVTLGRNASTTIDVSKLIAAQQPDPDGHVIPFGTREGSMVFSSAKGMTQWMTLAISIGILNVQAATCGGTCTNCCGYTGFGVTPSPGYCPVGLTAQCGALATYCNGVVSYFTTSSSWSSSNTSILTVNNTTQKGLVTGVAPGTANVTALFPSLIVYTGTVCSNNPPSCPASTPSAGGPVTVIRVDTQTVVTTPTDRTRKKLGVGERVTLTLQPTSLSPVSWSISGNGALSATTGNPVTFAAHDRASNPTITATYQGGPYSVTFNVIEPNSGIIEQEPGTGVWHIQGTVSCGFKGRPYIKPDDVSFQYIQWREGSVAGTASGYLAQKNGEMHAPSSWFFAAGPVTTGKGTKVDAIDTIASGTYTWTPYAAGTFTWNIPWLFRVGEGAEKQFTTVTHQETTDATGKITISKGGTSKSKNLNDPTSNY
jgi:hypothetical protein